MGKKQSPEREAMHERWKEEMAELVRVELAKVYDEKGEPLPGAPPWAGVMSTVMSKVLNVPYDTAFAMQDVLAEYVTQMLVLRGKVHVPKLGVFAVCQRKVRKRSKLQLHYALNPGVPPPPGVTDEILPPVTVGRLKFHTNKTLFDRVRDAPLRLPPRALTPKGIVRYCPRHAR